MLKLGVIGTGFITRDFIEGAIKSGKYQLEAIYSRSLERVEAFRKTLDKNFENVEIFTDMEKMAEKIQVAYIASPNSLHVLHAEFFLKKGIHAICEKPIALSQKDLEKLKQLSKNAFFFEAIRTIHNPNMHILKEQVAKYGYPSFADFRFMKCSSKYFSYINGEHVNVFDKNFGGGALFDLGLYCIYASIYLFGSPKNISASAKILPNGGVDGLSTIVMHYEGFDTVLSSSKISNTHLQNEIQWDSQTIVIDHITSLSKITLFENSKESVIAENGYKNDMNFQALAYANIINNNDKEEFLKLYDISLKVCKVMENAWEQFERQN